MATKSGFRALITLKYVLDFNWTMSGKQEIWSKMTKMGSQEVVKAFNGSSSEVASLQHLQHQLMKLSTGQNMLGCHTGALGLSRQWWIP